MTPTELIAEARELDRKATPGPWSYKTNRHPNTNGTPWGWLEGPAGNMCWSGHQSRTDAAFISKSREIIPALCDALEAAQKENAQLIREVSALAIESVEREKKLAKLESEVMAAVEAQNAQRWIPVTERLPEDAYGCLLIVEDDDYFGNPREVLLPYFAGYDGEQWNDGDGQRVPFEVTHWQPLPQPPKGED